MRITHILVILTLTQATTFLSDTYTLIYDHQSSLFSEEELAKNTEIKSTKDENVNYLDEQLSSLANADEQQTLLAYEKDLPASGDCIILYSQCNFKGASSKVCKDPSEAMSFQSPVYSIYVPDGQQFSTLDTNSQSEVTFLTSDDCLEEPIVMVGQLDFLIAQSSQYWIGESITTDQSPSLIQQEQEQAPEQSEVATESQEQITEQPQTEQPESQVEQPQTEQPQIQESEQPETQAEQPENQVEQTETQAEQPETQAEQVEQPETQAEQPEAQAEQVEQPETQAEQPEAQADQPETSAEQPETSAEQPVQTEAEDDKQVEQVIEKVEEVVEQVTDLQEAELDAQKAAQETKETDQPVETEGSVDDIPSVEVQEPEQTSEPLVGQTQLQK